MSEDEKVIPVGEAYLEEIDPELHHANDLAHRGMDALGRWLDHRGDKSTDGEYIKAWRDLMVIHEEYKKLKT